MKVYNLATNETSSGAKTTTVVNTSEGNKTGVFQVKIGVATVALEGRFNGNHDWETINTYTSSTVENVTIMPEMRVNITEYTSGNTYADLGV